MNTELTLIDESGIRFIVDVNQLTPMGFEAEITEKELSELRDDSGRFREFSLCLNASNDDDNTECIGMCRVHSVRRICADKSMLCMRFERATGTAYDRLAASGSQFNTQQSVSQQSVSQISGMDIPDVLRRA
ncbi:hypothetical protein [Thalassolituus maritimus]|uniref:Uncharacterized protein n=1 Tax=Thalassolituus maritimus TaxID=484498 RepID=A0ABQ0A1H0_9GAMM